MVLLVSSLLDGVVALLLLPYCMQKDAIRLLDAMNRATGPVSEFTERLQLVDWNEKLCLHEDKVGTPFFPENMADPAPAQNSAD